MEKKLEKLFDKLIDFIETESSIRCTKCRKIDNIMFCDQYDAVEPLIKDGWYATENNCYCPECNKKRKK